MQNEQINASETASHPIPKHSKVSLDGVSYEGEPISKHVKSGTFGTIVRTRNGDNLYHVMLSDGSGILTLEIPPSNQL